MGVRVPADLYDRETLLVRPRDFADRWANPTKELGRLADAGIVRAVSRGYWLIPPADRLTDPGWRPEAEAFGLALAVADYGPEAVALMGVSAARHHGALPRAVAVAVVAVPQQRPPLATPFGEIVFAQRDTARLATEPTATALVTGSVTTVEQTMLDLADRPGLGGVRSREVGEAITALALRADWTEVLELARRQRLHAAYVRARWVADRVLDAPPPAWRRRWPVDGLDLLEARPDDPALGIGPHAQA
jgi:predicted transcriptional regulator of viral defense system